MGRNLQLFSSWIHPSRYYFERLLIHLWGNDKPLLSEGNYNLKCSSSCINCRLVVEQDVTEESEAICRRWKVSDMLWQEVGRKNKPAHGKVRFYLLANTGSVNAPVLFQDMDDQMLYCLPPEQP
jgi:hypothetical protein